MTWNKYQTHLVGKQQMYSRTAVRREWFTCRCANFRRRGQSRTPTVLMKWRISHGKTSSQTITVDHFPLFLSIEMTTMESDQIKHRINSTEIFHRFDDSNWKHGHDWIATWMESNCNQTTIELEYGGKEAKWINWRPHHAQTITSIAEGMAILFSCHLAYVTLLFFQGSF
jgi:hypothetical protein